MSIFRRSKKPARGNTAPQQLRSSIASVSESLASATGAQQEHGRPPFTVTLGGYELLFQDGQWQSDTAGHSSREKEGLKGENRELREENNLLRYQVNVLLDMLTVARCDVKVLEDAMARTHRQ